jgi:hypothetical protein
MNRNDILRMAKQASVGEWSIFQDFMPELERFAALVAAAEREACAEIAEQYKIYGLTCADEIRARGSEVVGRKE